MSALRWKIVGLPAGEGDLLCERWTQKECSTAPRLGW